MTRLPLYLTALALLGLSLCTGCAGNSARETAGLATAQRAAMPAALQAAPEGAALLPAPATLQAAAPRQGSYTEPNLTAKGADFDSSQANSGVSASAGEAVFSPGTAASSGLGGAAFAVYHFNAPGYDRNPQLRITRSVNPADYSDSWIALGNFSSNRWDWFADEPDGKLDFASLAPYFSATDDLLVVVLERGTASSTLTSLHLGGPAPTASMSATPDSGAPPLHVTLDATASTPGEGSITKYEWDLDGDSVYEVDGGTTPSLEQDFSEVGDFVVGLRVTNSLGNQATATAPVHVSATFHHTFGRASTDIFVKEALDGDGNIYLCGYTLDPADTSKESLLLLKLDHAGVPQWARSFRAAESAAGTDLALGADGKLYVSGDAGGSSSSADLLQCWDTDGTLQWSKSYGTADRDQTNALDLTDQAIYIGGSSYDGGQQQVTMTRLDYSGAVVWSRMRYLNGNEYTRDVAIKRTGSTINGVILVAASVSSPDATLWKVEWQPDGSLISGKTMTDPSLTLDINKVIYERPNAAAAGTYYLGGSLDVAGTNNLCVLAMPSSGSSLFGTRFAAGDGEGFDLCFDSAGQLVLCGYEVVASSSRGILASFDSSDGSLLSAEHTAPLSAYAVPTALASTSEGLLLSGFTRNHNYSWSAVSPTAVALSATWDDAQSGTGTNPGFAASDYLGNVTNLDAAIQMDSDDSDGEGLVELRPDL